MKSFLTIALAFLIITFFHEVEGEQLLRRRLNEIETITKAAAEKSCKIVKDRIDRQHCVFDVLATQDLDLVNIYAD